MNSAVAGVSNVLPVVRLQADYVVVGGGVAGVCSAITAARAGLKVVLVQDRPVLGGNASSEVRLWALGATAHLCNNNRWSREGGVNEELLVENLYRNPEGNPVLFDALLIEKVWAEPNITLLLNTAVHEIDMAGPDTIGGVGALCIQNWTRYDIRAPLFCDTSGDGIVGFLAGAQFRIGTEGPEVFGEKLKMPDGFGSMLGHSIFFYTRDAGVPVKYIPPAFALKDIPAAIPRFKGIRRDSTGCDLWWLEWADELDRVFDTEKIRDELWRIVYGVWDYMKNSGAFPDVANLTLEWVGLIPGKREGRRFVGDYMMKQQDMIGQTRFDDAVAYGGWSIDLHPAAGVYSPHPGCVQYHSKGIYGIPYRCLYSRNVSNLFLGGRVISASHIVFGSTRVISTGALCAQAAAMAAVLCREHNLSPREVYTQNHIGELQRRLMRTGQYIPGLTLDDPADLVRQATLTVSDTLELAQLPADGTWRQLVIPTGMLLPLPKGDVPKFTMTVKADSPTRLTAALYISQRFGNYTPDRRLATREFDLQAGETTLAMDFGVSLDAAQYGFVMLDPNEQVSVALSSQRLTGVVSVVQYLHQQQNDSLGVEEIPFLVPQRRPGGKNLAMTITPPLRAFDVEQLRTGIYRPAAGAVNAWIAPVHKRDPQVQCTWSQPRTIRTIVLWFDSDYDHPMESVQMGHPESVVPFCVRQYRVVDDRGRVVFETSDNRHSRNEIRLAQPLCTSSLTVQLTRAAEQAPVSLFGIQAFE